MPGAAGASGLLSWDEIRGMAGNGFDIGSHTLSHAILAELTPPEARRELAGSRRRLEEELNLPVRALAYPNGTTLDFNPQVEALTREAGYSAAFTLVPGPARSPEVRSNPMAIRRTAVYLPDGDRRFRAKLAGGGRVKPSLS
jgi:peptidoglycan/xylan/chitin deacetylase (PgdA/CDA1 family)